MDELARIYGGITGGLCYVTSWIGKPEASKN